MTERCYYHFALTLTPPQYQVLLEAIESAAVIAEHDVDDIHQDIMCCDGDVEIIGRLEVDAEKSERDAAMLRNIKEAILNQINADPRV